MFSYPGWQDSPICGALTKSRDDDRITCVLYSSQHKASSFGVIRQITGIGAYQLCWNQIHGVLSNPVENTNTKKYENMVSTQLCHTWYGSIVESLLLLQNSSDPPLLLQYWHRLHKFWRQKNLVWLACPSWPLFPLHLLLAAPPSRPASRTITAEPKFMTYFQIRKTLMSMTMTIMTWESQFTAAFKRIESSRSGPAHHYWSNDALSDHHKGLLVMKIKMWTPNISTATRFFISCNIVRGMTRPIPPIWPALTT